MLAFVACFVGATATELVIADGTEKTTDLPVKGTYCDTEGTHGYMIYHADSLAEVAGGQISKIAFHIDPMSSNNSGCVLQLSLREIADDAIPATTTTYDGFTVCGTYTIVGNETTLPFEFDEPFDYSGEANLLVEVRVITKSDGYANFNAYGVKKSAGVNPSATHYGSSSHYFVSFVPKITMEYTNEAKAWDAKVSPLNLNFGTVNIGEETTLNVTVKNRGLNSFTPAVTAPEAPFSVAYEPVQLATDEAVDIPVTIAPTAEGFYSGTMTIDCGEAGNFTVNISGKAIEAGSEITLCDGSESNSHVPLYGLYYDTQGTTTQFIYPKEMLSDLNGRAISSVKFFATGNIGLTNGTLQLSVKEVDYTTFEHESAISLPTNQVTEMTVVATIVPSGTGTEMVFDFNEPFIYNGGNLAFETYVVENGGYKGVYWYGKNQDNECAYYAYTSSWSSDLSVAYDKFLPKMYMETIAAPNPEEHTYAVAGAPAALFGMENDWDPVAAPEMQMNDDGLYEWTSEETELEANTTVEFKVVQDHGWDVSYPVDNVSIIAQEDGVYTLNVTYNPENNEVLGNLIKKEVPVEHTYAVTGKPAALFGMENDWDPVAAPEMQMNDNGIYEWTSEETELEANTTVEFKVVQDHGWDVNYPVDNVAVNADKKGVYTLNVTYNPENNEVLGTLTLVEEIFETVYILGNVNSNDWATNVGVEMETTDGKIYTKDVYVIVTEFAPAVKLADNDEGYGFFAFTTKLMDGAEDWDGIAPYRFGAVSNGDFVVNEDMFGQELSLTADNGQAFKIPEGYYQLTVDLENMKLTIDGNTLTGVSDLKFVNAKSVRYYNLQGVESATPFDGFNIVVLEMPDGSKNTMKLVK